MNLGFQKAKTLVFFLSDSRGAFSSKQTPQSLEQSLLKTQNHLEQMFIFELMDWHFGFSFAKKCKVKYSGLAVLLKKQEGPTQRYIRSNKVKS